MNMDNIPDMNDYGKKSVDEQLNIFDNILKQGSPRVSTNMRPSKKSKIFASAEDNDNDKIITNALLLAAIERIERMQEKSLERVCSVEGTVNAVKVKLDGMGKQMSEIMSKVEVLETQAVTLQEENVELRDKYNKLEAHSRRSNLRVHGIPEKAGENTRRLIVDLFGQVSPRTRGDLELMVDVAHRLGPHSEGRRSHRTIIVRFLSRRYRDNVFEDAKTATVLQERKIRITQDLTEQDKASRNKLWPQVAQARKENKRAGFRGPYAYIEGRRITA